MTHNLQSWRQMRWQYLHFTNLTRTNLQTMASSHASGEATPLQAFLNMYGDMNWELVYVENSGGVYEVILKQEKPIGAGE